MERLAYVLLIGLAVFLLISISKRGEEFEDDEYDEVPKCESCAITSLSPKRVCPSGLCSQGKRIGCRI